MNATPDSHEEPDGLTDLSGIFETPNPEPRPMNPKETVPFLPESSTKAPSKRSAKPKPKRRSRRKAETLLYRYYDDFDVLLYVGVTANLVERQTSHETDSTWMDFATRSTIERFTKREDAESAEQAAIEEHQPLFNIEHNEHPDRIRRIVDYLIERDRRDLLVPLISRG